MTTKEYLGQISRLDRLIKNKLSEISQLKDLACSISAVQNEERVQSTPNFDQIGAKFAKIDEMERNIDRMVDEYVDKKNLIISQIDSIENEIYYDILFSRYIEKKTFEEIAVKTDYSFRNILRLHGKALQDFERRYGSAYK